MTLGLVTFGPVTFGPVSFGLVTFGPVTSVLASLTASPPIARSGLYRTEQQLHIKVGLSEERGDVGNVSEGLGIYWLKRYTVDKFYESKRELIIY